MATALSRAERLGDKLVAMEGRVNRGTDTTLRGDEVEGMVALHKISDEIETAAIEIIRAADSKATRLPGMLRRLFKKCSREPQTLVGGSHGPPTSDAPEIARGLLARIIKDYQRLLGRGRMAEPLRHAEMH